MPKPENTPLITFHLNFARNGYQGASKRGKKRSSLDVSSCFAPLMRWVISLLPRNIKQIALALDEPC